MSQIKSVHAGHRGRMRERFLVSGTQSLLPHQILEMLLFYAIPYKDTNPLSHSLLSSFGTLKSVFEADRDALTAHKGIGEHTADFLADLSSYALSAFAATDTGERELTRADAILPRLKELHENGRADAVSIVLIGNNKRLISIEKLEGGSIHSAAFDPNLLVKRALDAHASKVIVAHSHQNAYFPTPDDDSITVLLRDRFALVGTVLLEHYLITPHDCVPLSNRVFGADIWHRYIGKERPSLFADAVTDAKRILLCRDPLYNGSDRKERQARQLARLLSYAVKGDTSETARKLLEREDELLQLSYLPPAYFKEAGISENAAVLVKLAPLAYAAALYDEQKQHLSFRASSIASLFVYRTIGLIHENAFIALFDEGGKLIDLLSVGEGTVNATGVSLRRLTEYAYFHRARYACLAHNHPFGLPAPSPEDLDTTKSVIDALAIAGCTLLEHFVTAGTGYDTVIGNHPAFAAYPKGPSEFYDLD